MGTKMRPCPECDGTGVDFIVLNTEDRHRARIEDCPECKGTSSIECCSFASPHTSLPIHDTGLHWIQSIEKEE